MACLRMPSALRAGASAFALLVLGLMLHHAWAASPALPEAPVQVAVEALPLTQFKVRDDGRRFGPLEFRGGLLLTSSFSGFGGISGFTFDGPDGHFLAVTDMGLLLEGRLDLDGDRPTGLSHVTAAALRDDKGRLQARRGRGDAESIALAPDAVYVGLEDVNEIWRYPRPPLGKDGARVSAPAIRDLRDNLGLESLFYVPKGPLKGALIGIGEEGVAREGDLPGYIIGGPQEGTFTIRRRDGFAATDAALTPDGDVILLERHYTRATGVKMRLRRFTLSEVRPGLVIEGEVLGTFDMAYEIDNMEGLAISTNGAGETLLTLVSDDNFNPLQRTILLRFALAVD